MEHDVHWNCRDKLDYDGDSEGGSDDETDFDDDDIVEEKLEEKLEEDHLALFHVGDLAY